MALALPIRNPLSEPGMTGHCSVLQQLLLGLIFNDRCLHAVRRAFLVVACWHAVPCLPGNNLDMLCSSVQ